MREDSSLYNGVWTGRYWLKDRDRDCGPFSIWIQLEGERLQGSTLEPNRFALITDEQLDASIRGHIIGQEIVFLKSYRAFEHEPVYFEGELSKDGKSATGQWYFGWPNEWSGPFEISRQSVPSMSTAGRIQKAQTDL